MAKNQKFAPVKVASSPWLTLLVVSIVGILPWSRSLAVSSDLPKNTSQNFSESFGYHDLPFANSSNWRSETLAGTTSQTQNAGPKFGLLANSWRRTASGWESVSDWPSLDAAAGTSAWATAIHPAVVAAMTVLLSISALLGIRSNAS